jgi:hypothetical protein
VETGSNATASATSISNRLSVWQTRAPTRCQAEQERDSKLLNVGQRTLWQAAQR